MTLPPPIWPGWHTMPVPIEIRWSYEAWEGAYGEPWSRHWKPWPWEPEPKPPPTGAEIWQNILEMYKKLDENRTLRPQTWSELA